MSILAYMEDGMRIFSRNIRVRLKGMERYGGNSERICRQIVWRCWNGSYFQASAGHFHSFYMRDLGWCIRPLLKLGYQKEVLRTLEHVMAVYAKHNKITTTITPSGRAYDVYSYSPDSLAFLIHCLRLADAKELLHEYHDFIQKEIDNFSSFVIEKETGLVRADYPFSSIKDHAQRRSSMYNNTMAAFLSKELAGMGFENPLRDYNYTKILKEYFWTGDYFRDDLSGENYVSGDANLFPYWCGIFDERKILQSSISAIQEALLDKPFPLRYTDRHEGKFIRLMEILAPNYEGNTVWAHMGLLYIDVLRKINRRKASQHIRQYTELIERHCNFIEVFNPDCTPYSSHFYFADSSMLWASLYLDLRTGK